MQTYLALLIITIYTPAALIGSGAWLACILLRSLAEYFRCGINLVC